ncbi:hypothetical protein EMCRGX_G012083 [Ephydatia muelleri]
MEYLKLVTFLLICGIRGSSTQSLPCHTASGDNCTSSICPNTVVNYTCTITSGTPAVYTDWILSTGTCPSNTFPDMIRLLQFVSGQCVAVGLSMCGPFRASSILPSSGTNCLSSILTVNITAAMNGSTVMCNNTRSDASASTVVSMATINVVGPPGRPNALANTIGPGMVLVVVNPSSSGGLPTSYNVTISNSSSKITPAFLNGSAMVTFTDLTNSTNYTISAVATNCAGSSNSSNPTTIYVSWAAPPPSPPTSSASNPSPTSPASASTSPPDPIIGAIIGGVVGGVVVIVAIIIIIVLLICLCSSSKTCSHKGRDKRTARCTSTAGATTAGATSSAPRDPIATRQASSVPAEESLYDGSTHNQRVPEESLYDGGVGPAGSVPTGRGGNSQEAVYSQPDTSKKNTDKMTYATVQDKAVTACQWTCAAMVISTCGPYRASSIQSSDPIYCLSSILTVNITAAMNAHPGGIQATILTVLSNNPPPPDQLTVTWTPPTTGGAPTSCNVTINDSSSPVVIADNGSPVYTHTFPGLVSDTLYTVSVVAINCMCWLQQWDIREQLDL